MDALIHQVEKEAYSCVLRAFKCQSDVLTWEKAELMFDLRKVLNVLDDEHAELLAKVNTHSTVHQIREWRQTGCYQPARCSAAQPVYENPPHPTISASLEKQNTSQQFWHQHQSLRTLSSVRTVQHGSAGPAGGRLLTNGSSYSVLPPIESVQAAACRQLIGKKVWIRLPEDNEFYEAHISTYNPAKGQHALVYDFGEGNETMEWIDLNKIYDGQLKIHDQLAFPEDSNAKLLQNPPQKSCFPVRRIKQTGYSCDGDTLDAEEGEYIVSFRPHKFHHHKCHWRKSLDDIDLQNADFVVMI